MHLQDREFLHVLKDADIETANESGGVYNSQDRRAATRALHFLCLSGIYDVLDADMWLGMQWESLFHYPKCRADCFHFQGFFWTLFTIQ